MKETTHTLTFAGREFQYRYVDAMVPAFTLILRLAFGFYFLWTGFDKLITDFTAKGYLLNATSGPFKDIYVELGQSQTAVDVIDPLVIYGQILIGFALLFGLFTRFALFMGGLQMLLFWSAELWPEYNPILDERVFYVLMFATLGALGAGRILGVDALLEKWEPVRRIRPMEYALG